MAHLIPTAEGLRGTFLRLGFVTTCRSMDPVLHCAYKAAQVSDATVLLQGETGTGKQVLARAIHSLDPIVNGHVYFNEPLTPNIIAYKAGLVPGQAIAGFVPVVADRRSVRADRRPQCDQRRFQDQHPGPQSKSPYRVSTSSGIWDSWRISGLPPPPFRPDFTLLNPGDVRSNSAAMMRRRVSFRIADVFLPEPSEVLASLTPDAETNGVL